MKSFGILSALLLAVMVSGKPAQAVYVGVAVDSLYSSTAVGTGNVDSSGVITFYIPLNPAPGNTSGTFGVTPVGSSSYAGLQSDTCNAYSSGCVGSLDMFIHYAGPTIGVNTFSYDFIDLDISGANDTSSFFETASIELFDGNIGSLGAAVVFSALAPPSATGDKNSQQLTVSGNVTSNDGVWAHLRFTSSLLATSGTWRNTPETVYAWAGPVTVIPLPAALPLYGTGLAIMGLIGWRRKKKLTS